MPKGLIELQNVSFTFPDGKGILHDVSLTIGEGDLIIIQGKSGAGKSTFLRLLNRFCDASEGMIRFHGKPLEDYRIEKIRSTIMYLPQLPSIMDGTVEENLTFPFAFHAHRERHYDPKQARQWFDYFQLDLSPDQEALKLSIGQRQRIALIRCILLQPEVLLLDEPVSALDRGNKRLIEEKIDSLVDSSKLTVLIATHSDLAFRTSRQRSFLLENKQLSSVS